MECEICGNKIPKERIKILPDTTTCVKCSTVEPKQIDEMENLSED